LGHAQWLGFNEFSFPCTFFEPLRVAMCLVTFRSEVRSGGKSACICLSPRADLQRRYVKLRFVRVIWNSVSAMLVFWLLELVEAVLPFLLFIAFIFHIFLLGWDMYFLVHICNT
jgi:hypothetical protein